VDVVADRADDVDALPGGVVEFPVLVAFARGRRGQASPQPIVMITSVA
jgi:hypothetical protein